MVRVLIYDDNNELRESLTDLINSRSEMCCVASFTNCSNAKQEMEEFAPDVVLMDIDMPIISGIEGVSIIKALRPRTQIIMLTVFDDSDRVFRSILSGASGYLLKKTPNDKILEAILDVHGGGSPMSSRIARQVLELFSQKVPVPAKQEEFKLTKREHETLEWLVKGYSYKMIADKMDISIDTVRAHIKKIYEKLHVRSMNEAVAMAIRKGIVG
jgi:DNA-binding NarL/FixJ family response regulator